MPLPLQGLDEQSLTTFERDADHRCMPTEPVDELRQAGHVVGDLAPLDDDPGGIERADLMIGVGVEVGDLLAEELDSGGDRAQGEHGGAVVAGRARRCGQFGDGGELAQQGAAAQRSA